VLDDVEAWRSRRLEACSPIVYLDGLIVKVRQDGVVDKRTIYVVPVVHMDGKKEVPGLYMAGTEGAKFWFPVTTKLKNHDLDDTLNAHINGLRGVPAATKETSPQTTVQTHTVLRSAQLAPPPPPPGHRPLPAHQPEQTTAGWSQPTDPCGLAHQQLTMRTDGGGGRPIAETTRPLGQAPPIRPTTTQVVRQTTDKPLPTPIPLG
jgi:hypothetical protein